MKCPKKVCGAEVPDDANFCPSCATPLHNGTDQSTSNTGDAGRDINQYQAGRDLIFYPQSRSSRGKDVPEYEVKWSRRSPLTLTVLTWVSVILGLLSLGSGYKFFEPLIAALVDAVIAVLDGAEFPNAPEVPLVWFSALLSLMLLFVIAVLLRRIAKNETQHLSRFSMFPAITGWGRRIGFARLKGKCICGGKLRFYSRKVDSGTQAGGQGVSEREMTAQCVRDPKHHSWRIEATEPY